MIKNHYKFTIIVLLTTTLYSYTNSKQPIELEDTAEPENTLESDDNKLSIVTPAFQNPIHNNDLSSSTNPQFSILSSGRYYLVDNLAQPHNTASGIVLLINTNNVSLNLNSKTISTDVSGSLTTGTGIAIAKGKSNIKILNGYINGSDTSSTQKFNTGIDLSETAVSSGSGTSYTIKLEDISINKCKLNGISGTSINDLSITSCSINDCSNSGTANISGANLTTINNFLINNCEFNNNNASDGSCEGLRLTDCINGNIINITASSNQGTASAAGLEIGYSSTGSKNLNIDTINTSNNSSSSGPAVGLSITDSPLISISNLNTNSNSSSGDCCGIGIYNSTTNSNNCNLTNIIASQNNSSSNNAYGVYIESNTNNLNSITANNNNSSADDSVSGIFISNASNNQLINCTTMGNYNSNTSTSSSANTFGIAIDGNNNSCVNCISTNNITNANSTVRAIGIYVVNGSDNRLENCTSSSNNSTHTTAAVISAGFELNGNATRTQLIDCTSSNNLVGDGTNSGSNARSYGIYLANSISGADQAMIRNCKVNNNYVGSSGSGLAFGIYDNNDDTTILMTGNVAIGQGKCLSSKLDASLQWNNNSEPTSSQNYFFKHAGTIENPQFVIHESNTVDFASLSTTTLKWQNISLYY